MESFKQFLRECHGLLPSEMKDWHVIFDFGTVVRMTPEHLINDIPDVEILKDELVESWLSDFPIHRLKNRDGIHDIEQHFRDVLTKIPDEHVNVAISAYKMLIRAGYPFPGGEPADSYVMPLPVKRDSTFVITVVFPMLNKYIFTVADDHIAGREGRRLDYMFPKIKTIILPSNEMIDIQYE